MLCRNYTLNIIFVKGIFQYRVCRILTEICLMSGLLWHCIDPKGAPFSRETKVDNQSYSASCFKMPDWSHECSPNNQKMIIIVAKFNKSPRV